MVNFANGDMVGHTGIYNAIAKAVHAIDNCVKDVIEAAKANDYEAIIIADHGNADHTINADGAPNTAHSLNPVPFDYITNNNWATVKEQPSGRCGSFHPPHRRIRAASDMDGRVPHQRQHPLTRQTTQHNIPKRRIRNVPDAPLFFELGELIQINIDFYMKYFKMEKNTLALQYNN